MARLKFVENTAFAGVPPATGPETVAVLADELDCVTAAVARPMVVDDVLDFDPARLWLLEHAPEANSAMQMATVAVRDGTDAGPLPDLFILYPPFSECLSAPLASSDTRLDEYGP